MLILSPSIESERIVPLHNWVYVRRCLTSPGTTAVVENGRIEYNKGGVAVSDYEGDSTTWATILRVGPECGGLTSEHVGHRAMCAADGFGWSDGIRRIQGEEFFVREDEIIMITEPHKDN